MLVLLIPFYLALYCRALETQCPDTVTKATMESFHMDNCQPDKCKFHPHDHMTGSVRFIPQINSKSLNATMSARIGPIYINMPGFNGDGCHDSGITCPLIANTTYEYKISAEIPRVFWEVDTVAKFTLAADDGEYFICVQVPVEVDP
ncbi:Epididymal secretory protein E1 [Thelohanellus kitauei]|uniref:Epididymal secretory protein E1 n=1 Tax=Thelohanellus kitauei TaxID=669202 RepID=A0A0C2MWP3_THEKT|nr:Epididymal secretory protein E1 [Thelohanellus kitauei]